MSPQPNGDNRVNRSWRLRQFSVRTLLLMLTCVCLILVVWRVCVRPYEIERQAMDDIANLGGSCRTVPAGQWWLARIMGRQQFYDVIEVNVETIHDATRYIDSVARLPKLETLRVGYNFTDGDMLKLRDCTRIRRLFLEHTQVTDDGLQVVQRFPRLRLIRLGRNITDDGLIALRGRRFLAYVDLRNTQITDRGLEHLRDLPALHKLELNNRPITEPGLHALISLPKLDELYLAGCREISDEGFLLLAKLTQLKKLDVSGTRISPQAAESLRTSLPSCEIVCR